MDRHLKKTRLMSGVLFSAPVNMLTARMDIHPNKKHRGIPASMTSLSSTLAEDVGLATKTYNQALYVFSDEMGQPTQTPGQPQTMCLPILNVAIDVTVDGTFAFTELKQTFHNPSDMVTQEARHTFPLYDGAVVTSFECTVENVRHVVGAVKPRGQAIRDFEEAKRKKREAVALLEEHTPEIFETALGNIPPNTSVIITLKYVHELKVVTMEDEKAEGLLVTVPTSIAPRYGPANYSRRPSPQESLDIWVRVTDDGTIDAGGCRVESGHEAKHLGTQPVQTLVVSGIADLAALQPKTQSVWKYTSETATLNKDFIFVLQRRQEHQLRSRALITPANDHGHAAMAVSIRPTDIFGNAVRPEAFTGELLFLIDRSASMGWTARGDSSVKIDTARDAMSLVLSGLPETCAFNIISFGSEVRGMWEESRAAGDAGNMEQARAYVAGMDADMGGTEVLLALKGAVKHRLQSRSSTQVILLTDGEVESEPNDPILNFVWEMRRELGDKIRFFTLGIGDRVSHRIMESIAELGGGYCDVVDVAKRPRWEDRLNRMLRSAMEPDSWSCSIDLGPGFERQDLMVSRFESSEFLTDQPTVPYIQAPYPVPPLHPYTYKSIFFLLDLKKNKPPSKVLVTTTTAGARERTYTLDVQPAGPFGSPLHHLAAKAALLDLEAKAKRAAETENTQINAEFIGTTYAISSRWTAFVAVADDAEVREVDIYQSMLRETDIQEILSLNTRDIRQPRVPSAGTRHTSFPSKPIPYNRKLGGPGRGRRKGAPSMSVGRCLGPPPVPPSAAAFGHVPFVSNSLPCLPRAATDMEISPTPAQTPVAVAARAASLGPITWRDALRCQVGDCFSLSQTMRNRLRPQFCAGTAEKLQQDLLCLFPAGENTAITGIDMITDTVMMIQYFSTHLAAEEDSWYLIMTKAERAVRRLLGIADDAEGELEPLNELLRLSVEHVHYELALKDSCAEGRGGEGAVTSSPAKSCRVCQRAFDAGSEVKAEGKVFKCWSDACYDAQIQDRKSWGSWDAFWEHQLRSGHLLCPEEDSRLSGMES